MRLIRPLVLVFVACLIVSTPGCLSRETVKETHTTHLIDSGEPINNGLKVLDDRLIEVAVFEAGKAVGTEERRISGLRLLTPTRYRELVIAGEVLDGLMEMSDLPEAHAAIRSLMAKAVKRNPPEIR